MEGQDPDRIGPVTVQDAPHAPSAAKVTQTPRVLFLGDLAPTGFGSVTVGLGGELLKRDLDVRFISQNEYGDDLAEPFRSVTVDARSLRTMYNMMSGDQGSLGPTELLTGLFDGTAPARLLGGEQWGGWKPDAAILLGDYAATRAFVSAAPDAFGSVPTFHYCPIEGTDLPPRWADLWKTVRPVAMSKFGAAEIERVVGHPVPMVYHGIDTDKFHPVTSQNPILMDLPDRQIRLTSRDDCLNMWSAFFADGPIPMPPVWALRTDRHMPRKRYNSLLRAMVPVLVRRPEVGLVLHCMIEDQGGNLHDTISKIPDTRDVFQRGDDAPYGYAILGRDHPQIILVNSGSLPTEALCSLYNAAALYVTTSAEGFGLTIAEALACGTPALGPDYSAVPEVIGPAGQTVRAALIDNEYDHFWCQVDEADFGRQAEFLLTHQEKRQALGRKGPRHVASSFRWSDAAGAFADLIHEAV